MGRSCWGRKPPSGSFWRANFNASVFLLYPWIVKMAVKIQKSMVGAISDAPERVNLGRGVDGRSENT
jgi:hypothetical protein